MLASAAHAALVLLLLASLAYSAVALLAAGRFLSRRRRPSAASQPPASILVPLCGADPWTEEICRCFCRQDYPAYQVIFGVHRADDPAVPIVHAVLAAHPGRDLELVVAGDAVAPNPKVDSLRRMLTHARHELVVMVDGDVQVTPDFLARVLPPLADERVGLVTCLYRAGQAAGLLDRLEAVGIAAEFAPGVLVAWLTEGMSFALGAVMATRQSVLRAVGGLEALAPYLADDYQLGNLVRRAGHEVYLSPHVVETFMASSGLGAMLRHQLRWSRATRVSRPRGHLGLFVTHGTTLALLALLLDHASPASLLLPALAGLAILAQGLVAWVVGVRVLGDGILRRGLWLLPLRDLLGFAIWCASLLGREVEWRGARYTVTRDGRLAPARSR